MMEIVGCWNENETTKVNVDCWNDCSNVNESPTMMDYCVRRHRWVVGWDYFEVPVWVDSWGYWWVLSSGFW